MSQIARLADTAQQGLAYELEEKAVALKRMATVLFLDALPQGDKETILAAEVDLVQREQRLRKLKLEAEERKLQQSTSE